MLRGALESAIHAAILAKCRALGCVVLALGGVEDHVHLLVGAPTSLPPSQIVGEVKGASSHLANHELRSETLFRWQGAYGLFSVSHGDLARVQAYVNGQREHHRAGDLVAEWETSEDPR